MCFVVYLRFPAVSRLVFDMFRCRPVGDGVRLLEANYQQECFEPEHWIFFCIGVFFLCVYTLGIPCFILYQLTSYKTTILGRPASEDYKPAVGKKGTDGYQPQVGGEVVTPLSFGFFAPSSPALLSSLCLFPSDPNFSVKACLHSYSV